jgi:hypothetical protein
MQKNCPPRKFNEALMLARQLAHRTDLSFDTPYATTARTKRALIGCAVAVSASMVAGCGLFGQTKSAPVAPETVAAVAPTPPKPTALTADADAMLKAAEQSVVEARIKRSLWTAATEQLAKAKAAAKVFDSEATTKHAREVIALCELSNKQINDAPVAWQ